MRAFNNYPCLTQPNPLEHRPSLCTTTTRRREKIHNLHVKSCRPVPASTISLTPPAKVIPNPTERTPTPTTTPTSISTLSLSWLLLVLALLILILLLLLLIWLLLLWWLLLTLIATQVSPAPPSPA